MKKTVPHFIPKCGSRATKQGTWESGASRKNFEPTQLTLWESQQKQDYPVSIERLPDDLQWWSESRYWIIHKDSKRRVPGSFSEKEARKIQEATKNWDWRVNSSDRKVACGLNLLALAEGICARSIHQKSKAK